MKFVLTMIFLSACFTNSAFSQAKPSRTGPVIVQVEGYTIRVLRADAGTFGYEIRKGADVLIRQKRNPYTGSQFGLKTKDDAIRTATWLVKTILKKQEMQPQSKRLPDAVVLNRPIPAAVANELKIQLD